MKEHFKNLLKVLRVYHPLQSFYRSTIFWLQRLSNRIRYHKYKGDGFLCNVCQSAYKRFVPEYPSSQNQKAIDTNHVIAGYGENILCPNCMSTARDRLVIAMLDKIDLSKKKILHFSPEKNVYRYIKSYTEDVITADLSPGFYKNIDEQIQEQDATQLNFENNSFDLVIANHILEHIPDDKKAMRELCRVLRPQGVAILQVPYSETIGQTLEDVSLNDPAEQSKLFGQQDHVRIYQLNDYIQRLRLCGFDVSITSYAELHEYYKYAIQKDECFLHIRKTVTA